MTEKVNLGGAFLLALLTFLALLARTEKRSHSIKGLFTLQSLHLKILHISNLLLFCSKHTHTQTKYNWHRLVRVSYSATSFTIHLPMLPHFYPQPLPTAQESFQSCQKLIDPLSTFPLFTIQNSFQPFENFSRFKAFQPLLHTHALSLHLFEL